MRGVIADVPAWCLLIHGVTNGFARDARLDVMIFHEQPFVPSYFAPSLA